MDFFIFSIIVASAYNVYRKTKEQTDKFNSDEFFRENAWKFGIDPNYYNKDTINGNTKTKMD